MLMLLVTVVIVGVSAYLWCTRGFFSALVHLVCVLAAGAVAFGVWEPLAYWLMDAIDERGALAWVTGTAWGLSLALPFAATLAILRGIVDKILPANAQCDTTTDYIGGGVCGFMSGVICAGVIVLSIGYLRLPSGFGGYQAVVFTSGTGRGSLEQNKDTFVPWVDKITAGLYSRLSLTTLRTGEPLARWHPELATEPGAMRTTYEDVSRNTVKPSAFSLMGWYTVGPAPAGEKLDTLLSDRWNSSPQKFTDLEGETIDTGYLAGCIVKFLAAAKEKTGQVVVGNGQVRLVVQSMEDDDDTRALQPIAVATNVDDPSQIQYARFRYDADNVFFTSVGGAAETVMSFEFPVPGGYRPIALYVKGSRVEINPDNLTQVPNYPSPEQRDQIVQSGQMQGMGGIGPRRDENGNPIEVSKTAAPIGQPPILLSNTLGVTIQKGTEQGLDVAEGEGGGWVVQSGKTVLRKDQLARWGAVARQLQINRVAATPDTVIAKVNFTPAELPEEFWNALERADKSKPPVLVDNNGTTYQPVGYIFTDSALFTLSFDRGHPIEHLTDLPAVSRSNPEKHLTLIYAVSFGVSVERLMIGDVELETFQNVNATFHQK